MRITYDPAKRDWTLAERGLDFEDATEFFQGVVISAEDSRHDYGETRVNSIGFLRGRLVVICWTGRYPSRHFDEESQ